MTETSLAIINAPNYYNHRNLVTAQHFCVIELHRNVAPLQDFYLAKIFDFCFNVRSHMDMVSGPHFNIRIVFPQCGNSHRETRRSAKDRLSFDNGNQHTGNTESIY